MIKAGYVGILTGMRLGNKGFSVSVNFRVTGDGFWENLKKAMGGSWPIGFLVREILTQKKDVNFNSAKAMLRNSALIAPVYFTMSGYDKDQGCLVTRDREKDNKCLEMDCNANFMSNSMDRNEQKTDNDNDDGYSKKREFIVQTNIDHWSSSWMDNIMWSIQRRSVASEKLLELNGKCGYKDLWKLMNEHPIFNEITVYGTLMSVSDGYLETRLPNKRYGFVKDYYGDEEEEEPIDDEEEWMTCKNCARRYHDSLNAKGECSHIGEWHSTFNDCDKLSCGWGLKTDIGKQHWGCCYSVEYDSKCSKSEKHEAIVKTVKLGVGAYKT